jgi:galactokinase
LGARIMGAGFGGSIIALLRRGSERIFVAQMGRPGILCATADGAYTAHALI